MKRGTLGTGNVGRYLGIGFVAHVHSLGQVRHHDRRLEPRLQAPPEVSVEGSGSERSEGTGTQQPGDVIGALSMPLRAGWRHLQALPHAVHHSG
jgi:hypothetical protein